MSSESPSGNGSRKLGFRARLRRFLTARQGATAVEFALLAPPFFALFFAVIEIGLRHYVYSQFEQAVFDQANLLQNPATRPLGTVAVRNNICARVSMLDCAQGGFFVEVATLSNIAPVGIEPAGDAYLIIPNTPAILRVVYPWQGVLPVSVLSIIGEMTPGKMRASVFFPAR